MTALDLDIVRVSRPGCDYDLDVKVGGEWVASAKNFHHADEAAHEIWYRTVLDQPLASDDPLPDPGPGGPGVPGDERPAIPACPKCMSCRGSHRTWQCPFVLKLLYAPPNFVCVSCGYPLELDGFLCVACHKQAEDMPDPDDYAASLELAEAERLDQIEAERELLAA